MSENNNNYSNFNGYQAPPTGPVVYLTPNQVQDTVAQDKKKANSLGVWGIVLGILGCCCGFTSIIGLILSIVGLGKDKKNGACIAGLIICGLGVLSIVASLVQFAVNPQQYNDMMNQFMQQYSSAYSQAASGAYNAILSILF